MRGSSVEQSLPKTIIIISKEMHMQQFVNSNLLGMHAPPNVSFV